MTAADLYRTLTWCRRNRWDFMLKVVRSRVVVNKNTSIKLWMIEEIQATQALLGRPLNWWRLD